jgi:hypothetical protein
MKTLPALLLRLYSLAACDTKISSRCLFSCREGAWPVGIGPVFLNESSTLRTSLPLRLSLLVVGSRLICLFGGAGVARFHLSSRGHMPGCFFLQSRTRTGQTVSQALCGCRGTLQAHAAQSTMSLYSCQDLQAEHMNMRVID